MIQSIYVKLDKKEQRFLKRLGLRLRALRNDKGWTLEETEEHGWRSWRHLQRIEAGKNVTIVTIHKVSELYGLPLARLLEGL
jgi:transcriptional regulator with XRE-family HTH domain